MNYQFNILNEKMVYNGFFRVTQYQVDIEYYNGTHSGPIMRECLGKNGCVVAALPYDPSRKKFVLIEQFRIGAMASGLHPWQIETVAGFMDKAGETAEEAMQRELAEEIGSPAKKLTLVREYYPNLGGSGGKTYLYFAEIDAANIQPYTGLHAEGEDIRTIRLPYETAFSWLKEGKIHNATLIIALQQFLLTPQP